VASNENLGNIPLEKIDDSDRAREDFGDFDDLVESIIEKGVIQPIAVQRTADGFRLLAGGRRTAAARAAGLSEIPALILHEIDTLNALEIELLENIERKDLLWWERANLVDRIHKHYEKKEGKDWSGRKTASLLGRSHGGVANHLQMAAALRVIPDLKEAKNEDEARRRLKKLEEAAIVRALSTDQAERLIAALEPNGEEAIPFEKEHPGLKYVQYATDHYRVGDTFQGLEELIEMQVEMKMESAINLIECDPPFGIDLHEQKKRVDDENPDLDEYIEVYSAEYVEWLARLCPLLFKVAARNTWMVFWYGPTWDREVRDALEHSGWHVDHIPAVWVKGEEESEGSGQTASPDRYLGRATEFFYIARKGNPVLGREGRTNVFSHKPLGSSSKYHPTQKPLPLYVDIIQTFSLAKGVCLIPFLGSGQALKAAYSLGSTGFGWDLSEKYKKSFLLSVEELGDEEGMTS
jgi:ParB/RepB/Spo0J family partition protein